MCGSARISLDVIFPVQSPSKQWIKSESGQLSPEGMLERWLIHKRDVSHFVSSFPPKSSAQLEMKWEGFPGDLWSWKPSSSESVLSFLLSQHAVPLQSTCLYYSLGKLRVGVVKSDFAKVTVTAVDRKKAVALPASPFLWAPGQIHVQVVLSCV